jgi:hypothetical protein
MVISTGLPHRVSDSRANRNEVIFAAVEVIGRSKTRRAVFEAVYFHKRRVKDVDQIVSMTRLSRMQVLQAANTLAQHQLIGKTRIKGRPLAYQQEDFYQANKKEILRQLDSRARHLAFPTKRNPRMTVTVRTKRASQPSARFITIDDIDSFSKVKKIKSDTGGQVLSEEQFKRGLLCLLSDEGVFKDWGGEQNDVFSTLLRIRGKRKRAAFALKGPGAPGKMMLRHLGKNADQIPRLFKSPAEVFIVQHHEQIDQSVIDEMETHATVVARKTGRTILFGVIDGKDSRRLISAYPAEFGRA